MTAIQHDKCYHLTLALESKDCGYNPKRITREVDDLKSYIQGAKIRGGWCGDYDMQLSRGALDDQWYSLRLTAEALLRGTALSDVYIFTNSGVRGEAWLQSISSTIRRSTKWHIRDVSEMNVKTIQYIKD